MSLNEVSAHAPIGANGSLEVYGGALAEFAEIRALQRLVEQIEMKMLTVRLKSCQTAAIYRHAVSDFDVRRDPRCGQRQLDDLGAAAQFQANADLFNQTREHQKTFESKKNDRGKKAKIRNGHSEKSADSRIASDVREGEFVRMGDVLNGRIDAFVTLVDASTKRRRPLQPEMLFGKGNSGFSDSGPEIVCRHAKILLFHTDSLPQLYEAMKSCLTRSRLALCLICAALCSCASISLKKVDVLTARAPTKAPSKIFLKPPEFYDAAIRVDRSGPRLDTFKHDMQERFTRHLVRRLSKHVAPAEAVAATAPLPRGNFWLIVSRFDRIQQGSRMLRSVIGFGVGGTKLETSVVVYDLSRRPPRPFLLLQTTGGSNAAPGAIGTATYFATGVTALFSAGNLFEGTRSGLTFDNLRTVRQIAAALSEYLVERGALSPDKPLRSKRLPGATEQATARGEITVTPADAR
jgi:hypothetical protein